MIDECIRLPRSVLGIATNKDLWELFGYLLAKADNNGEVNTSLATIQRDLMLTQHPLRNMLARLEKMCLLSTQRTSKGTKITLCTITDCSTLQSNKIANKTASKAKKFKPPTKAEAQAYITKMQFHWGDADTFIAFYESKGWKIGNTPMKDWKAAMRTWEINWQKKYGEQIESSNQYSARRGVNIENLTETDYGGAF